MRTHDFKTITIEKVLPYHLSDKLWEMFLVDASVEVLIDQLCLSGLQKLNHQGIRLVGIGIKLNHKNVDTGSYFQLSLFPNE